MITAMKQVQAFLYRVTHWQEGKPDLHDMKELVRQAIEQYEQTAPVGRFLIFIGKGTYPAKNYTILRTYDECTENAYPDTWKEGSKVYTNSPAQQPLTDEQIEDICWTEVDQRLRSFARAIEAAHGIKGASL